MLSDILLGNKDKQYLLKTARESIVSRLEDRQPIYEEQTLGLIGEFGAFVTLHIEKNLRGCIGTLKSTESLIEAIKGIAKSSAFSDSRFPPISSSEAADMTIEISVLTPLVKTETPESVEVGKHGLYLKRGSHSGILLPQVPVEQGWDREQFLRATCRKAGLLQDAWKDRRVDLYTFSAVVFSEET